MKNLSNINRRDFLLNTAKGTIGLSLGLAGVSQFAMAGTPVNTNLPGITDIHFAQQPLPYSYNAFTNVIDEQTMEIHYSKHAAAYCKNLNEAVVAEKIPDGTSLENILENISHYAAKMRNNAGGHYNHEMFWKCMRPEMKENAPNGSLLKTIESTFTSFGNFKNQFSEFAKTRFGSGWAWLYIDGSKKLKLGSTPNQDNPLMDVSEIKGLPLLGIDVWEHAYYLKYQNKRADYINNWWNIVNWDYVQQRFTAV